MSGKNKTINTKADPSATTNPYDVMKASINAAIDTALKANCRPGAIEDFLEGFFDGLRRLELARQDKQRGTPKMLDAETLKPIDLDAKIA